MLLQYIARRFLISIPTILGVVLVVFLTLHFLPIDPAMAYLTHTGPGQQPVVAEAITEEQLQEVRRFLGLDRPLHVQFGNYVWSALQGDFGESWRSRRPVSAMIQAHFPFTLQLAIFGVLISVLIGVTLGIIAALRQRTWWDSGATVLATIGVSMPNFWLGLMLMLIFGFTLRWFPAYGYGTLMHLVLPAFTLGFSGAGMVARLTRSSLLEVLRQDYIRTARSKGLSNRIVTIKHAMRNAFVPVITVLGLSLGSMLSGTVIVENVFGTPGLGRIAIEGLFQRDFPVVQTTVLLIAAAYVMANLLVDISYGFLDPRIRYD